MADSFLGEIKIFSGAFRPRDYAFCNGDLLAINQFQALFALFGTTYGGNGVTSFGLPEMRGRIPVHTGTGPGLSSRIQGQQYGTERVLLSLSELPAHTHAFMATQDEASSADPTNQVLAQANGQNWFKSAAGVLPANFDQSVVGSAGDSRSHNNISPVLGVNYIIALQGVFPSRN